MTIDLFDMKRPMLGDSSVDIKKLLGNVPWITKEGFLDPAQFPIGSVLKQALADDDRQLRSGLNMLGAMNVHGRTEAGVFLLGLLVNCDDNWEKRIKIVEAMKGIDIAPRSSGEVRWTICNLIPFAKRRLSGHESGSSVLPTAERHEEP